LKQKLFFSPGVTNSSPPWGGSAISAICVIAIVCGIAGIGSLAQRTVLLIQRHLVSFKVNQSKSSRTRKSVTKPVESGVELVIAQKNESVASIASTAPVDGQEGTDANGDGKHNKPENSDSDDDDDEWKQIAKLNTYIESVRKILHQLGQAVPEVGCVVSLTLPTQLT
jgi:antitoxin (DNA-binding transcriptional repressor) of toxin-antitoxin stability system